MLTNVKRIKAELMIFALKRDYFAYGTIVEKMANGKYKVIVDGEKAYYTLTQFSYEWDQVPQEIRETILEDYESLYLL